MLPDVSLRWWMVWREDGITWILHRFGDRDSDQGNLEEAEKMYLRALQGCEKAWGAEHTSTLGTVTKPRPFSTTLKGLQKNANAFAAAGQCRMDKARSPLQAQPLRWAFSPVAEKRPWRALGPVTTEKPRIPGT